MSPKSIALLVVGMVLISSVFFIFHVSYPSNPATIKINHVPKNAKPPKYQIFQNQTLNQPGLGLNKTSFTPSGNTTLTLQGYVYNLSSSGGKQPIANALMGVAVLQAMTLVKTNSQGFYQVQILSSGQGTFAFKIFQFNTTYKTLYIGQGLSVLNENITMGQQLKYSVSGITESHGKSVPGVLLTFSNFWGQYASSSGSSGAYSLKMVDGGYTITDAKTGFAPVPLPTSMNVSNAALPHYNLNLTATNKAIFYMNGYVLNQLGKAVPNSLVTDNSITSQNSSGLSLQNGFYNISVEYYLNQINVINATGYTPLSQNVYAYNNITDQNFSLSALDPFTASYEKTGITSSEPQGLGKNLSMVNYHHSTSPVYVSGKVISRQTGMPVPNQQFTLYTSVNGTFFNELFTTNSSGYYKVYVSYTGDYHINVTSTQFYDSWLNQTIGNDVNGAPIYVSTSPNKVYHISGGIINGITNTSMPNATLTVYSGTGGILETIHANASGQFNLSLLGGTYTIGVSYPGFNITNVTIPVTGNLTGVKLIIDPTTSIAGGSTVWHSSSGSGAPGINGSSISSQLNSTQNSTGINPGTNSSSPVTLKVRMATNVTNKSIANTYYEMFVRVNGLTLKLTGETNSSGYTYLNLSYGGSYIVLPEMVDYTGIAKLVNTTQYQSRVLDLYLNPLPVYNESLNLSNPLHPYSGSSVPESGLSVTNYSMPIAPSGILPGANYTVFYYDLPNGTYDYQYSNSHYVYRTFNVSVAGSNASENIVVQPYVLDLSWNTAVSWSYTITGQGAPIGSQAGSAGNSSVYIPLENGAFALTVYLGNNSVGSRIFNLNMSSPADSIHFSTTQNTYVMRNVTAHMTLPPPMWILYVNTNLTSEQALQNEYVSQIAINGNVPSNSTLYLGAGGTAYNPVSNIFTIPNYFVLQPNGQTSLSITADISLNSVSQFDYGVNLTITYYTASLTG